VELTRDSDYFSLTLKSVVKHIHMIVKAKGHRHRFAQTALEILLVLVKKTPFPLVDAVWINDLLKRAAWEKMDDEIFTTLLKFNALRKGGDAAIDPEVPYGQDPNHIHQDEADSQSPGGTVRSENRTQEYTLLDLVLQKIKARGAEEGGWQDDAVYGGLITIRDIPGLRFRPPGDELLETLSKAMDGEDQVKDMWGSRKVDRPFRIRTAAYDIVLAVRIEWLKSVDLRETLKRLDFPRKLHGVVIENPRPDRQHSFLEMMEILSETGIGTPTSWKPWTFGCRCITEDQNTRFASSLTLAHYFSQGPTATASINP
jgi:hypothetical protein